MPTPPARWLYLRHAIRRWRDTASSPGTGGTAAGERCARALPATSQRRSITPMRTGMHSSGHQAREHSVDRATRMVCDFGLARAIDRAIREPSSLFERTRARHAGVYEPGAGRRGERSGCTIGCLRIGMRALRDAYRGAALHRALVTSDSRETADGATSTDQDREAASGHSDGASHSRGAGEGSTRSACKRIGAIALRPGCMEAGTVAQPREREWAV